MDLSQTDKLFWLSRTRRVGVFLVAALDESTDAGQFAYGLGGFVADQTEWNKFEAAWKPTSDKLGALSKVFHMTDCQLGWKHFADVPRPERDSIIKAMVDSVLSAKLYGVHTAIDLPVFNSLFPGEDERSRYYLCFATAVRSCAMLGDDVEEPVAFAFEQKEPFEFMCHAIYKAVKGQSEWPGSRRLGTLHFYEKRDLVALQAADFLAYEGVKLLSETVRDSGRPLRKSMERVSETGRVMGYLWNAESLPPLRAAVERHGKKTLREFFESAIPLEVVKELQAIWKR